MYNFFVIVHALVCILMVVVILMQSGRGGGLTEGFASAESMFGAKTNSFMIKTTTVFAMLFLVMCLGLAVMSSKTHESLMPDSVAIPKPSDELPLTAEDSTSLPEQSEATESVVDEQLPESTQ